MYDDPLIGAPMTMTWEFDPRREDLQDGREPRLPLAMFAALHVGRTDRRSPARSAATGIDGTCSFDLPGFAGGTVRPPVIWVEGFSACIHDRWRRQTDHK